MSQITESALRYRIKATQRIIQDMAREMTHPESGGNRPSDKAAMVEKRKELSVLVNKLEAIKTQTPDAHSDEYTRAKNWAKAREQKMAQGKGQLWRSDFAMPEPPPTKQTQKPSSTNLGLSIDHVDWLRKRDQKLAREAAELNQKATKIPNSAIVRNNGKKSVEVSSPETRERTLKLFAQNNPEGYKLYNELARLEKSATSNEQKAAIGWRKRNLLMTGKATGPETSDEPSPSAKFWDHMERSVGAIDEVINHPGDRIRKAIKAGKVPNNSFTQGIANFNDYFHPMTGFLGSPENVQSAIGGVTGKIANGLSSVVTYPTDLPRGFIENHMKPGPLRDAVGIASGATGLSKSGQLIGIVPGAFDVPNWSLTKAVMAPRKYFDEGSNLLDEDTPENRFNLGMHLAGPVADLGALFGQGPILEAIRPRVKTGNGQITTHLFNHALDSRKLPEGGYTIAGLWRSPNRSIEPGNSASQIGRLDYHKLHKPQSNSFTIEPELIGKVKPHLHHESFEGGLEREWPQHKIDRIQREINLAQEAKAKRRSNKNAKKKARKNI